MHLNTFLFAHKTKDNELVTHTRIGGKDENGNTIYGGKYSIPPEKMDEFYSIYYNHVFTQGLPEYLTEKHNQGNDAVLYVDLDFRYVKGTSKRQITKEHILEFAEFIQAEIQELTQQGAAHQPDYKLFISTKDHVNVCDEYTKDGIHIASNLIVPRHIQQKIRNNIIKNENFQLLMDEIGCTNTPDDVYDAAVTNGTANSQLIGSKKPTNEPYVLRYEINDTDCIDITETDIELMKTVSVMLPDNTVRDYPFIPIDKPTEKRVKPRRLVVVDDSPIIPVNIDNITSAEQVFQFYQDIKTDETEKIREFLFALPLSYSDGYHTWLKVGHALKCEGENHFILWIMFSTNSEKFAYSDIPTYYDMWVNKFLTREQCDARFKNGGLTFASIADWLKTEKPDEFRRLCCKYNVRKYDDPAVNIQRLISMTSELHKGEIEEMQRTIGDYNKDKQKEMREKISNLIEEQTADTLDMKSDYFDEYTFKVMNPACFGRRAYDKTSLITTGELSLQYENVSINEKRFTDIWRKRPSIKCYEKVDFLPFPRNTPFHVYNTFTGLAASKLPPVDDNVNIDIFLQHMRILTGKEDASYQYLLKYMAHMVQRPGEIPKISLVFQSDQGVGKNVFFENFGYSILGNDNVLQTAEMDKVIGRFSMIDNKIMVIMDETSGKDSFSNSDKIKNIITAEYIAWERKGIDGIKINNCGRYFIFSNNSTPVKIEMSDRRFVVYQCSNDMRNNIPYFREMVAAFNNPEKVRRFYDYLMNIDIVDWDMVNTRPITKAYKNIQSANIPLIARYLEFLIEEHAPLWPSICNQENNSIRISSKNAFDVFTEFCRLNKNKFDYTSNKFGRELINYEGIEKVRFTGGSRGYVIDNTKLIEYMTSCGYIEEYKCVDIDINE